MDTEFRRRGELVSSLTVINSQAESTHTKQSFSVREWFGLEGILQTVEFHLHARGTDIFH